MRVSVLCYHAHIIASDDYAGNGHIALAEDLERLHAAGRRIVPLARVVDALDDPGLAAALDGAVALSFDDGTIADFKAVEHPEFGTLPGFLPLLEAFAGRHDLPPSRAHATCFVIASDTARREADEHLLFGRNWVGCDWWKAAETSGRMAIENHSWDHNMALASEAPAAPRDSFEGIDTAHLADLEIARASQRIERETGRRPCLFAYPYGHVNAFLSASYLPGTGPEIGLRAAFTTAGEPVTRESDRWLLPRYVHGFHWRDPAGLDALLDQGSA